MGVMSFNHAFLIRNALTKGHAKKCFPKEKNKIDVKKKGATATKVKKKKSPKNWDNYYGEEEHPNPRCTWSLTVVYCVTKRKERRRFGEK